MAVQVFQIIVMLCDGKTGEMQLHLDVYKQPVCKVCGNQIETKIISDDESLLSSMSKIKKSEILLKSY